MALTPQPIENRWDPPQELGDGDELAGSSTARTCSPRDRAVVNFGGGNTSVKVRQSRPHRTRDDGALGQGLGQRPRDDRRSAASPGSASTRSCRSASARR